MLSISEVKAAILTHIGTSRSIAMLPRSFGHVPSNDFQAHPTPVQHNTAPSISVSTQDTSPDALKLIETLRKHCERSYVNCDFEIARP
jgi:hypothetical protein